MRIHSVGDGELPLGELPTPELDELFAARVLRMVRAELAPDETGVSLPARLQLAVRSALIPALLITAGGCRTVLTLEDAKVAFEHSK